MAYEGQRVASYAVGGPVLQRVQSALGPYSKYMAPMPSGPPNHGVPTAGLTSQGASYAHVPAINSVDSSSPGSSGSTFGPGGAGSGNGQSGSFKGFGNIKFPGEDED